MQQEIVDQVRGLSHGAKTNVHVRVRGGGEYRLTKDVLRVLTSRKAAGLAGLKGHSSRGRDMGSAEWGS